VLDGSMLNIALPSIARDFGISASQSILVVNAYQLTVSVGLLPLAAVGDAIGYRRVNQSGLTLFILGTLACAGAPNLTLLTLARAVQGLGAAGIMSVSTALVRHTYPAGLLGRGIGFNSMTVAASSAAGPALSGLVLSVASWHWLFILSVPLAVAALLIGLRSLPEVTPAASRFDPVSAALSVCTMGLLLICVDGAAHGTDPMWVGVGLVAGCSVAVALIRRESVAATPVFPVDLLRRPIIALSVSTSVVTFIAQMLTMVSIPFMLQRAGFAPGQIGLAVLPWPLAIMLGAPLAGYLADRWPAGLLGGLGLLLTAASMALLGFLPTTPSLVDVAWRMALCGAGAVIFAAPNVRLVVGSAPRHRSGAAGGLVGTVRLTGQTLGAAVAALLFHLAPDGRINPMLIAAGIVVVAATLSFSRLAVQPGN
jgi:DHA2 family multidrug resistance protein-like MFS transporter